jgi:hypothetical protein
MVSNSIMRIALESSSMTSSKCNGTFTFTDLRGVVNMFFGFGFITSMKRPGEHSYLNFIPGFITSRGGGYCLEGEGEGYEGL